MLCKTCLAYQHSRTDAHYAMFACTPRTHTHMHLRTCLCQQIAQARACLYSRTWRETRGQDTHAHVMLGQQRDGLVRIREALCFTTPLSNCNNSTTTCNNCNNSAQQLQQLHAPCCMRCRSARCALFENALAG